MTRSLRTGAPTRWTTRGSRARIGAAVAAVAALALTAGCSSSTGGATDASASPDQSGSSQSADASATRTVTDIDGTPVEIPQTVTRIADLWHANNQIVLLLGGGNDLVATTSAIQGLPWFSVVDPSISDVPAPVKGTDVNMEELLGTSPQVVLASDQTQIDDARSAGLPAVHVNFQDFDGLKKTVQITADVIGTDEAHARAEKYIDLLDQNLDLVHQRLSGLSDADTPKVLHIVGGDDLTKVDGSKSFIGEWMNATGATNSLDGIENLKEVTLEQIIASDPDIIIVGGTQSQQGVDQIMSDPAWSGVKAVQDKQVVRNPVGTFNWDRYSAEVALQVLWAAKEFHPDTFSDIDLVARTKDFYQEFYGYQLSDDQANAIIAGDAPAQ